jgi:hypothetical protein
MAIATISARGRFSAPRRIRRRRSTSSRRRRMLKTMREGVVLPILSSGTTLHQAVVSSAAKTD